MGERDGASCSRRRTATDLASVSAALLVGAGQGAGRPPVTEADLGDLGIAGAKLTEREEMGGRWASYIAGSWVDFRHIQTRFNGIFFFPKNVFNGFDCHKKNYIKSQKILSQVFFC